MSFNQNLLSALIILFLAMLSSQVQANPVACFNTNMGNFCMTLLERHAPKTVANFLNYIDNGAYAQGVFHRSIPGFVVQGGGFKIINPDSTQPLAAVDIFNPVENEFGVSNTRGAVAMAKLGNDPDSATSQWFVNLADNSANLDFQNGGFTVFGQILYGGMTVFDAIASLPTFNFGGAFTNMPTINYDTTEAPKAENFIQISSVAVHDVTGVFDGNTVAFVVDIGNNTFFDVQLQLVATDPDIVFELDPASVTPLSSAPENKAIFSAQEGSLVIPSVIVNESTVVNNVIMSLTDPSNFQFTLISFE